MLDRIVVKDFKSYRGEQTLSVEPVPSESDPAAQDHEADPYRTHIGDSLWLVQGTAQVVQLRDWTEWGGQE